MRIPVTAARTFTDADSTPTSTAVIASDNVARRFWPGQNPIGKRIKIGGLESTNPWLQIVGTVAETKYRALPRNPTADPDLYFPALDRSPHGGAPDRYGNGFVSLTAISRAITPAYRTVNAPLRVSQCESVEALPRGWVST